MPEQARATPSAVRLADAAAPAAPAQPAGEDAQAREFLRLISHELRTPLNSILGFSEVLIGEFHGPLGAPQYREYAQIVRESGQQLLELINQLLELARLEAGVGDFSPGPQDLDAAVEGALAALGEAAAGVMLRLEDAGLAVIADGKGLKSLLNNLLLSALAAASGQVNLSVRRRGRHAEIIAAAEAQAAGVVARSSLVQPVGGLTLPMTAALCRAMGGALQLDATAGGLSITARLPLA